MKLSKVSKLFNEQTNQIELYLIFGDYHHTIQTNISFDKDKNQILGSLQGSKDVVMDVKQTFEELKAMDFFDCWNTLFTDKQIPRPSK